MFLFVIASLFITSPITSINVGVLVNESLQFMAQPIIDKGIDMAQAEEVLVDQFHFFYRGLTSCDGISGMRGALSLALNGSVDVIIGSSCNEDCLASAQVTDYFNIPYLPLSCLDPTLDNSTLYKTKIRIFGSFSAFGWALTSIYNESGWKKTAIVAENGGYLCSNVVGSILKTFKANGILVTDFIQLTSTFGKDEEDMLMKLKYSARIVILCHSNNTSLKNVIFAAQKFGMTDPKSYAWIVLHDIYKNLQFYTVFDPWIPNANISWSEFRKKKQAFKAVKILTYKNFTKLSDLRDTFNESSTIYINHLADIMYIYLKLRDILVKDGIEPNGINILNASKNKSFRGRSNILKFGDNGDRIMPFYLWTLESDFKVYNPMLELIPDASDHYKVTLLGKICWGSSSIPPPDTPMCGFYNEFCGEYKTIPAIINTIVVLLFSAVVFIIIIIAGIKVNRAKILKHSWRINSTELEFIDLKGSSFVNVESMQPRQPEDGNVASDELKSNMVANYRNMLVKLECFSGHDIKITNRDVNELLQEVTKKNIEIVFRDCHNVLLFNHRPFFWSKLRNKISHVHIKLKVLQHDNLVPFVGAFEQPNKLCLVVQYNSRGSLQDVLYNEDINLDWSFRASFLHDIVKGMSYLHNSFLNFHGRLSSNLCMVTNRWVVKIEGFGLLHLRKTQELKGDDCYKNQLWVAPEIIRSNMTVLGSQKGDVFSFSIVAYEILFRIFPYNVNELTYKEIIEKIENTSHAIFRPTFPPSDISRNNPELLIILAECWDETPANRPNFNEIDRKLGRIIKLNSTNLVDNMLDKLEKYAENLELIVQQRTAKLIEEQKKTDMLLHSMLPPFVAEELKAGRQVEPRLYRMTSIFFSDIVGFTTLSSESTPFEIVNLLNDLYGTFDDTIAKHKVYKVETIGDAYMVVSGMPEETNRHVVEICNMALDLLSIVGNFKIRHRPSMTLMLRIGIHSGPCAAGVVGRTMPRYCLFGDTVNTASRMESTGKALKIHLSEPAKDELMKFPGYVVQLRGPTELKGKGLMITYWLLKKDND